MYYLRFDGSCSGNPCICGIGFLIYDDKDIIFEYKKIICLQNTNNFAEYNAILLGIKKATELNIKNIIVQGDSNLVIKQLNNEYKVNSENLKPLYNEIIKLLNFFDSIKFYHIYRNKNILADKLAKSAILEYNKNI